MASPNALDHAGSKVELPDSVNSPITGRPARLERWLDAAPLLAAYRTRFDYDATPFFDGVSRVGVYRCESGYRFYFPFSLAGDESLYRCLEKFDWNYKEDKWEHDIALRHIRAGDRVLDVGCGEGNFLDKVRRVTPHAFGIELNKQAANVAVAKGIGVHRELIEEHAPSSAYDVVTTFQVLEHIADPLPFINNCLKVLRAGGTLIVGVPNNDAFLRLDPDAVLNQPPHHMGLWNRESLTSLGSLLGLDVLAFEIEPLNETGWFQAVIESAYMGPFQRRLFHRLGFGKVFARFVSENAHTIAGHTIVAFFRKPLAQTEFRKPGSLA